MVELYLPYKKKIRLKYARLGETLKLPDIKSRLPESLALKLFIFLYFSSIGIFLPFLPLLFSHKGLSNWQIGILFSIGPFLVVTIQPLWGFVSDRLKTVKKLVLFQLLVTAALALPVFSLGTFELLLPALFLFNIFSFPIIPLTDSLTLSMARSGGGHYGSFRLWGSLGFGLSAAFFGLLFRSLSLDLFPVFYFTIIVACIITGYFLPDAVYIGRKASISDVRSLLSGRRVILFLAVTALLSSSNRANDAFLGIFLKGIGGDTGTAGYAWTVAALSEVPVMAAGGFLFSRFSEIRLLAASALVFSARWALFSAVTDPYIIVLIQLLHSFSFGLFFICSVSYLGRLVPDRLRSSGQGLLACFLGGVGGVAGSTLGGLLFTATGPGRFYAVLSFVALASFFLYLFMCMAEKRSAQPQADKYKE